VYKQQGELARTKIIDLETESKIFLASEDLGNLEIQSGQLSMEDILAKFLRRFRHSIIYH
jgi:hypothetical protein